MRILLPPSEGKQPGALADRYLATPAAFPTLDRSRRRLLGQLPNATLLRKARTAPAIELFNGVLFQALDFASLTPAAQRRASDSLAIFNGLTGIAACNDLLPNFKLPATAKVGETTVAAYWRSELQHVALFEDASVIVDARSGDYQRFWQPQGGVAQRTVVLKVVSFTGPKNSLRKVAVSHFNKATKGEVVRALLSSRARIRSIDDVAGAISKAGWEVELLPQSANGSAALEVLLR